MMRSNNSKNKFIPNWDQFCWSDTQKGWYCHYSQVVLEQTELVGEVVKGYPCPEILLIKIVTIGNWVAFEGGLHDFPLKVSPPPHILTSVYLFSWVAKYDLLKK